MSKVLLQTGLSEKEYLTKILKLVGFHTEQRREQALKKFPEELRIRLLHDGAFVFDGSLFCSVHADDELNKDGSCSVCLEVEDLVGAELAEGQAMNNAQLIHENDSFPDDPVENGWYV
jgi:hypothetical protein